MGHRQPVQHAKLAAAGRELVGPCRVGHGPFGHERDDRVHTRVDPLDPREMRGQDLPSRDVPTTKHAGEIEGTAVTKTVSRAGGRP